MNISVYFKLSLNSLRANKIRSILTMLGIIIGVASVILLVSIGTGLQAYVTSQFTSLGSNVVFVLPGKVDLKRGTQGRPLTQVSKFELQDVAELNRIGGPIKQASPMIQTQGILRAHGESVSVPIIGVWENVFDIRNLSVHAGKRIAQSDVERSRKVIVLGSDTAKNLFGTEENPLNQTVTINEIRYTVGGVLESKGGGGIGANLDEQVYIPLSTALRQFNQSKPAIILVEALDQASVEDASSVTKKLLLRRLKEDDFTVLEQKELLSTINQFLGTITLALGGIAAISLLVGGIGIMNIMLVSVTERTREIGLRKAVGAPPEAILIQFLIEAVVLSLVGGIIGILLGSIGAVLLSRVIQTSVSLWSVVLSFSFSAFIGIVFGVAPAIRAARLDPITALRYE
ncbi:MAG: ABC transporter permease [Patescibacteria group bacterium]